MEIYFSTTIPFLYFLFSGVINLISVHSDFPPIPWPYHLVTTGDSRRTLKVLSSGHPLVAISNSSVPGLSELLLRKGDVFPLLWNIPQLYLRLNLSVNRRYWVSSQKSTKPSTAFPIPNLGNISPLEKRDEEETLWMSPWSSGLINGFKRWLLG